MTKITSKPPRASVQPRPAEQAPQRTHQRDRRPVDGMDRSRRTGNLEPERMRDRITLWLEGPNGRMPSKALYGVDRQLQPAEPPRSQALYAAPMDPDGLQPVLPRPEDRMAPLYAVQPSIDPIRTQPPGPGYQPLYAVDPGNLTPVGPRPGTGPGYQPLYAVDPGDLQPIGLQLGAGPGHQPLYAVELPDWQWLVPSPPPMQSLYGIAPPVAHFPRPEIGLQPLYGMPIVDLIQAHINA